jgi:uncharacterized protein (TIGR02147 family)
MSIVIFHYSDYRNFLKDAIQERKERDRKFSQRFIVQRLGIKSSGWLADILSARKKLARTYIPALSNLLQLNAREELYFETLVSYNHAKTLEEKNRAYEKLLTFHEIPKDIIGKDRFEYFSKWYYAAIREQLLLQAFRGDYKKLAHSLLPSISTQEARQAIQLLEELGMIKKYAGGEFRPSVEHVQKQGQFATLHYLSYIQTNMQLGMGAIERIPKDERDISALTLTMSQEAFLEIKDDIKALRQKMIQLSENENKKFWKSVPGGDSRRVYQAVFELFPVTKAMEGN